MAKRPPCLFPGCPRRGNESMYRGYCMAHYDLLDDTPGACTGPVCDRKAVYRQTRLCRMHQYQLTRSGTVWALGTRLNKGKRPTVICVHESGCTGPVVVWGLCEVHGRDSLGICWVRDCSSPAGHKQSGMCSKHRSRERSMVHSYGFGYQQREEMARRQGYRCAMCPAPDDDNSLHIDHDHDTGLVRGLLCGNCNRAIGLLRHNPAILAAGISYLKGEPGGALPGVA